MGNSIPHGDRLHECSATCPEYKNGPMPGTVLNYQHDDGRHCIIGPDGIWRHWDHPVPEPGPREVVDYKCLRSHPEPHEMKVDLSSDPPSPLRIQHASLDYADQECDGRGSGEDCDRGDFGMPGIGMIKDMGVSVQDLKASDRWPLTPGSVFQIKQEMRVKPNTNHKIDGDGVHFDYGEQGNHVPTQTEQAKRILGQRLPDVIAHFCERNAEYGEEAHVLGVKGQFADINRKVIKLKRYLWDDVPVPPGAESIETIAGELIGHLLILIDEMASGPEVSNGHGEA